MGIGTAMIGAAALLTVAYVNSFVAEGYRRFLDGTTLAAALAGELKSHFTAITLLNQIFDTLRDSVKHGKPLSIRRIPIPTDPIFDAAATKIGLLGTVLAHDTVYIYEQLRAFRMAMDIISELHREMDQAELETRLSYCQEVLGKNVAKAEQLIDDLEHFANRKFSIAPQWWIGFMADWKAERATQKTISNGDATDI